jgi:ApbE superfamily uncharacterized protein (UPF0280 family)
VLARYKLFLEMIVNLKVERNEMYEPRWYRDQMHHSKLHTFTVSFKETDLWIGVNQSAYSELFMADCRFIVQNLYTELHDYLGIDPGYQHALTPYTPSPICPAIAHHMSLAAKKADVGPMAAVAGAFAQEIGHRLEKLHALTDIIIENGGDIYLRSSLPRRISIWAGNSLLSGKLAIEITPNQSPLGICTSSATVGPSLSFGNADAVTILCKDAATADAYATRIGNMVKSRADIEPALEYSSTQADIDGVVIIIDDHIGVRGKITLHKA